MDNIWMTAKSLTQAQRMMRVLKSAGIATVLQRAQGAAAAKGCGYMIGIKKSEEKRGRDTLGAAGIAPERVFYGNGTLRREAEHDLL